MRAGCNTAYAEIHVLTHCLRWHLCAESFFHASLDALHDAVDIAGRPKDLDEQTAMIDIS